MTVPFSWELPYAWPRKPVLARNVVCTSQPLAAQAGLAMLADGGSAVDAALAAAITLTLVEPVSNGIGSDAFAIVWDGARLHGLNASGRSPAAWTPEYFRGGPVPVRGWNSVTVPGAVSAWTELHARFGRLPFARVFEPAIGYGREGFLVSPTVAAQWAGQAPELRSQPGFAEAFLPGGRAPAPGERFRLPEHAATLETIAATGGEAFYRGELAATMAAHSTTNGGAMLASDLAVAPRDLGRSDQHRLPRLYAARDPTERSGDHRVDRARHAASTSTWLRSRWIRPTACTCRSRRSSWPSPMRWPTSPTSTTCRCGQISCWTPTTSGSGRR